MLNPSLGGKIYEALKNYREQNLSLSYLITNCCEENPYFLKISSIKLELFNTTKYYDISLRSYKINSEENFEVYINDVSKTVNAEKEILKNKFKGLTLAKIAHELKNPINTINLISKSMKKQQSSKSDSNENSSDVESSDSNKFKSKNSILTKNSENDPKLKFINYLCNFLILLIEDLNSFVKYDDESNQKPLDLTYTNLKEILMFCYLIFETRQKYDPNKPNLKIVRDFDPSAPKKILTNATKLKQVILNLMSNSYKFTAAGEVKLLTKVITNEMDQKVLRITIKDDGAGLTPDEQKMLFKPFTIIQRNQNLNSNGSGLGLLIVKDTLIQLNSEIQFNSSVNEGSSFYFDIKLDGSKTSTPSFSRHISSDTKSIDQFFFINPTIKKVISGWDNMAVG